MLLKQKSLHLLNHPQKLNTKLISAILVIIYRYSPVHDSIKQTYLIYFKKLYFESGYTEVLKVNFTQ